MSLNLTNMSSIIIFCNILNKNHINLYFNESYELNNYIVKLYSQNYAN